MRGVDRTEHGGRVVRINIADEAGLHAQRVMALRPVLERKVNRAGAEVAAADPDLADRGEPLAGLIRDLSAVNLVRERGDPLLLQDVEVPLVDAVRDDILPELAAAEVMQDQSLLAGVDHRAVVELLELFGELRLAGELRQRRQYVSVHLLGRVVVDKALRHRHAVLLHAGCAVLSLHRAADIHAWHFLQRVKGCQRIQIVPVHHGPYPPLLQGNGVSASLLIRFPNAFTGIIA